LRIWFVVNPQSQAVGYILISLFFSIHPLLIKINIMDYGELKNYFIEQGLDTQTAGRLAEAISDAGGVESVKNLLDSI
jgi:hypothetical protein